MRYQGIGTPREPKRDDLLKWQPQVESAALIGQIDYMGTNQYGPYFFLSGLAVGPDDSMEARGKFAVTMNQELVSMVEAEDVGKMAIIEFTGWYDTGRTNRGRHFKVTIAGDKEDARRIVETARDYVRSATQQADAQAAHAQGPDLEESVDDDLSF